MAMNQPAIGERPAVAIYQGSSQPSSSIESRINRHPVTASRASRTKGKDIKVWSALGWSRSRPSRVRACRAKVACWGGQWRESRMQREEAYLAIANGRRVREVASLRWAMSNNGVRLSAIIMTASQSDNNAREESQPLGSVGGIQLAAGVATAGFSGCFPAWHARRATKAIRPGDYCILVQASR